MADRKVSTGTTVEASADVREWRALLARHADMTCALDRALQAGHQLGMSEYEVLERLAELPEQSAKIQQIAGSVHLSQSALSRVIGRLEAADDSDFSDWSDCQRIVLARWRRAFAASRNAEDEHHRCCEPCGAGTVISSTPSLKVALA